MKKEVIDGDYMTHSSPIDGSNYISIPSDLDMTVIDIEEVKIIGTVVKTKEKIELVMDKNMFFEWKEKIKQDALRDK